jgi:hypothetical protein
VGVGQRQQWSPECELNDEETAKSLLACLVFEFPERKAEIVGRVRTLWQEGYNISEIEFIVTGEIRAAEPGIRAERAERERLIRDPKTRKTIEPRDGREFYLLELLSQLDAERAETDAERARTDAKRARTDAERARTDAERVRTGAMRAETDAMRAQTDSMADTGTGSNIQAGTGEIGAEADAIAANGERIRLASRAIDTETESRQRQFQAANVEALRNESEADADIDAQMSAMRARVSAMREKRVGVESEASPMCDVEGVEVRPVPPPAAPNPLSTAESCGKKKAQQSGQLASQHGVAWRPFGKK